MKTTNSKSSRLDVGVPKAEAIYQRRLIRGILAQTSGQVVRVCKELDSSHGIADVVVVHTNGGRLFHRPWPPSSLQLLNQTSAKILSQLKCRRWVKIAVVSSNTGIGARTVTRYLRQLAAIDLIKVCNQKAMLLMPLRSPFPRIEAYEVKVADWRHGLYQATHYRTFANRVALAVPDDIAARISAVHASTFRMFQVGLVGLHNNETLRWYIRPRTHKPTSRVRALTAWFELWKRVQC